MTAWHKSFEQKPLRTSTKFGAGAIGVLLLLIGLSFAGMYAINVVFQPMRIVSKTLDADNVIHNYEWFHQQYQDVIAIDGQISDKTSALASFVQVSGERSTWNDATQAEWTRQNSIVSGLTSKRRQMVADYNAAASMVNRTIFRVDTPSHIE